MIPLGHRSVVLSLYTTLMYIVYMIVCGIIGLGAKFGSWAFSIFILGTIMLMICGWAIGVVRRKCVLPDVSDMD
jgi:hypothetical protein